MQAATRGRVSSPELRPFFIQSTVTHDEEAVKLKPGLVSRSLVQNFQCAGVFRTAVGSFQLPLAAVGERRCETDYFKPRSAVEGLNYWQL